MFITKLELELAYNYLISRSFRGLVSLLSLIGIAIGVAALIVVTSVMDGFKEELLSNVVGVGGHVNIGLRNYTYDDFAALDSSLAELPYVSRVIPALEMRAIISNGNENAGILVRGMKLNDLEKDSLIMGKIVAGEIANFEDGIIIGKRLAEDLGLRVGDEVTFLSASYNNTMLGPVPRIKRMKVAAIFLLGLVEYDSAVVYMPFDIASLFFRTGLNTVSIYLDDPYAAYDVSKLVKQKIPGFYVSNWQDKSNPYFRALKVEKTIMSIILMMIVLVAAFNIISGLFMLVDEKKQSIAILRTMGMTKANIIKIFVLCGSIIGVVGTGIGTVIGLVIALNINELRALIENVTGESIFDPSVYFVDRIPVSLDFVGVSSIAFFTILVAFFATIPPAYKASREKPGTILR